MVTPKRAMSRISDADLEALLDDTASDRVERKRGWTRDAPEQTRQAICAFANDLPNRAQPGFVFVGGQR